MFANVPDVVNLIRNGAGVLGQRPIVNLATGTFAIGKCDGWYGGSSGGVVTAGTISQSTAAPLGRTGFSMTLVAATLTGAGVVNFRQRIESRDAVALKNQQASFSAHVYQDTGGTIVATVVVRKANAQDNFGATTVIATSGGTNVGTANDTLVALTNVSMGDCSNGIEIEVQFACGAVTTKNFYLTEACLASGPTVPRYPFKSFDEEMGRTCYFKTFPYATAPAQNAGTAGAYFYAVLLAGVNSYRTQVELFKPMRPGAAPTIVTYNPSAANANWRNTTLTADSGACTAAAQGERTVGLLNPQVAGDLVSNVVGVHFTADWEL